MNAPPVEPLWRWVFRCGIAPEMSTEALSALRHALVIDDPALLQEPTPLGLDPDSEVLRGCPIGIAGIRGHKLHRSSDLLNYLIDVLNGTERRLGPLVNHYFNTWWYGLPRAVVVPALLALVEEILRDRVLAG